MLEQYTSFPWGTLCAEMARLKVKRRTGGAVPKLHG